jgi:predicted nucleic acid-binding protein
MNVVLDACAAVEIVFNRLPSKHFYEFLRTADCVYSTELFKAETANTLWKYVRKGFLSKDKAVSLQRLAVELIDDFIDINENSIESLHEAIRLDLPVYDLLYMTLARRTGSILITMDKKMAEASREAGITVVP